MILDSGNRREFETGAVRDMQEGKGRCDLLPLGVAASLAKQYSQLFLYSLNDFQESGSPVYLYNAMQSFIDEAFHGDVSTAILEVAKHFEDGCKKYGEDNWKKGIPTNVYIDSAVRHYLKFTRGDTDERHDRAVLWNLMCCAWTCSHKPELNNYDKEANTDNENC